MSLPCPVDGAVDASTGARVAFAGERSSPMAHGSERATDWHKLTHAIYPLRGVPVRPICDATREEANGFLRHHAEALPPVTCLRCWRVLLWGR